MRCIRWTLATHASKEAHTHLEGHWYHPVGWHLSSIYLCYLWVGPYKPQQLHCTCLILISWPSSFPVAGFLLQMEHPLVLCHHHPCFQCYSCEAHIHHHLGLKCHQEDHLAVKWWLFLNYINHSNIFATHHTYLVPPSPCAPIAPSAQDWLEDYWPIEHSFYLPLPSCLQDKLLSSPPELVWWPCPIILVPFLLWQLPPLWSYVLV